MARITVAITGGLWRRCWQVTRVESRVLRWRSAVLFCGPPQQTEQFASGTSPPGTQASLSSNISFTRLRYY